MRRAQGAWQIPRRELDHSRKTNWLQGSTGPVDARWHHSLAAEEPLPAGVGLDLEEGLKLLEFGEPPCRDLLWYYYVLGFDYQELADQYALSYDAVRMKIKRCLERAQALLGQEGDRSHV